MRVPTSAGHRAVPAVPEGVDVGRVEQARLAIERQGAGEDTAAHVGVERLSLHTEAGSGLGGGEPAFIGHERPSLRAKRG